LIIDGKVAEAEANRFAPPTDEERREQEAIIRAYHASEGLATGTVVGYMGKFGAFWQFREWSRAERGGDRDLFLLLTPAEERRRVWLDYIAYLVDILRIKGRSCFEHLSATKKVLSRNGMSDLEFADDSAPEVKEAKSKAKYTNEELRERADASAQSLKLPMFEELEDLLYRKLWMDSESESFFDRVLRRGTWLGIALMIMTGARPCNIIVKGGTDHTIRARDVTLLLTHALTEDEIYLRGGDQWPVGYTMYDAAGVEADYLSQKTGQKLGRKVIPAVDTRAIRFVRGMAWWFQYSGVRTDDMLLTMYRQSPRRGTGIEQRPRLVSESDISTTISGMAYRLGFERSHFSSKSCRIGLVTGAGWRSGIEWESAVAQETARMGGWAESRKTGAMRRYYDLSTTTYRKIHPDLALKQLDVWEMLPYRERAVQPRPDPQFIGQPVRTPEKPARKRQRKK